MSAAIIEHINITVPNPESYAQKLCDIFDWHIRWSGPAMSEGFTVHVGGEDSYVALYASQESAAKIDPNLSTPSALNHIAVTVEDLDATETKIIAAGYKTENHDDYAPGRRFYFRDENGLGYEVVSYLTQKQATQKQITRQLGIMARFGALMK